LLIDCFIKAVKQLQFLLVFFGREFMMMLIEEFSNKYIHVNNRI